jgi:aspartate/glutamate racemase
MSQERERMLLTHNANGSALRDSMEELKRLSADLATVPSVTVASLLRESGMPASPAYDWFGAITKAVFAATPRRVGVIATSAVIEHSELVQVLRGSSIDVVCASHIQDRFHEWVLSCGTSGATVPPHNDLVVAYRDSFRGKIVDTCLLACTEACLPEADFREVHPTMINALLVLEEMIISWMTERANKPLHHTADSRSEATVCVW